MACVTHACLHWQSRARQWVAQRLKFDDVEQVSLFEITIRVLGGLLSAYELSGDSLFLQKAEDLGARMLPHYSVPGRGMELQITSLSSRKHENIFTYSI